MFTNFIIFGVATFSNFWIFRILNNDKVLAVLLIATSFGLFLFYHIRSKRYFVQALILSILVLFFQYQTTEVTTLSKLDVYEYQTQQKRLNEYPPLNVPLAHYLEQRKEAVSFYKIVKNFFEAVDLNVYFFGSYPRPRIAVSEFEKFPYIFLPFFLLGLKIIISKRKVFLILIASSLLIVCLIGYKNNLGLFSIFPIFCLLIYLGLERVYQTVNKLPAVHKYSLFTFFILLVMVVLVQLYSYGKY